MYEMASQQPNQGTCTRLLPAQSYTLLAASLRTTGRAQCPLACVRHGLSQNDTANHPVGVAHMYASYYG